MRINSNISNFQLNGDHGIWYSSRVSWPLREHLSLFQSVPQTRLFLRSKECIQCEIQCPDWAFAFYIHSAGVLLPHATILPQVPLLPPRTRIRSPLSQVHWIIKALQPPKRRSFTNSSVVEFFKCFPRTKIDECRCEKRYCIMQHNQDWYQTKFCYLKTLWKLC